MPTQPPEGLATLRDVQCANSDCGKVLTIAEPSDDGWDAITEPDLDAPGRQSKVTGWRIVIRCNHCGSRTAIVREDTSQ